MARQTLNNEIVASDRPAAANRAAVWIAHNYDGNVGFAWNNITRLFSSIEQAIQRAGHTAIYSYASVPSGGNAAVFEFDPYNLSLGSVWRLRREIRARGIRYAYLTDQPPFSVLYLALRLSGVKRIVVHSRDSVASPYPAEPARGWVKHVKTLVSASNWFTPDRIYAVSGFVAHRLQVRACFARDRIRVIYNGIDLQRFKPTQESEANPPTVFVGCRATPEKGVDVLFRAAGLLKERNGSPGFQIRFAGEGYYMPKLRKLVEELRLQDDITFLGEVKDISTEMSANTIVVIPSVWGDACPSAVLEAMAAGKAVIATRAGGIPELLEDGVSGIVVEPGDAAGLADALDRFISDPQLRREMGTKARERAERMFSVGRYHEETIAELWRDFPLQPQAREAAPPALSDTAAGDVK